MKFEELDEFKRDLKRLLKKYQTLEDDLKVVKRDLADEPGAQPPLVTGSKGWKLRPVLSK